MFLNLTIVNQAAQPFINTILGPLFGAFMGVFAGFAVTEWRRRTLNSERKSFFKNLILSEIDTSITIIENAVAGDLPPIPNEAWTSLVNSGDLALFTDKSILLHEHYFSISHYNNKRMNSDAVLTRLKLTQKDLNEPDMIIKADEAGAYYILKVAEE
jgi:hypothetical protein